MFRELAQLIHSVKMKNAWEAGFHFVNPFKKLFSKKFNPR